LGAEHTRRDVRVVLENGFVDDLADDLDENWSLFDLGGLERLL